MSRTVIPTMILVMALGSSPTVWAQTADQCFLGATASRYGGGGRIQGNVGTIEPGGLLQLGRRFVVEAGSIASADTVRIGEESQVAAVAANELEATRATVGESGPVLLPLVTGFCPVPAFGCGGEAVMVRRNKTLSLLPGSYGAVELSSGADLVLGPGTYEFCSLRAGRKATVMAGAGTALNVQGTLALGSGSEFGTDGAGLLVANVGGGDVAVGRNSRVTAVLAAPAAELDLGRGVEWRGTFCAAEVDGERRLKLECDVAATTSTTAVPTTTSTVAATTSTTAVPTTTSTVVATTSTTAVPTTTSTVAATTSTTAVPTTTSTAAATTTTSTSTAPTTTTTAPPLTCGAGNALDVTATLVYEPRIVGGVFGMFLEVDYPASVSIPGSGTAASARARFTNLIGSNYRFVPSDIDSDGNLVDDRGRTLVTANTAEAIPSAAIERVRFDCPSGRVVQPAQLACRPTGLADSSGQPFPPGVAALVSCSLSFATP